MPRAAVFCLVAFLSGCEQPRSALSSFLPTALTHDLSGTVRSAAGPPITGATVTFTAGRRATSMAAANSGGFYRIAGLEPGTIVVTISAPGYLAVTQLVVIVEDVTLDVSLDPAPTATPATTGS